MIRNACKRALTAGLVAAAASSSVVMAAVPASASGVDCENSMSYFVDGMEGTVVMYPKTTCYGDTLTIAITGVNPYALEPSRARVFERNEPGLYMGYTVSVPNEGGEFCLVVDTVWTTWDVPGPRESTTRHCVQF